MCAVGTSEQSFYRRDDCDGCLCAAGSVWIHVKDKRYFGGSARPDGTQFCVDEASVSKETYRQKRPTDTGIPQMVRNSASMILSGSSATG